VVTGQYAGMAGAANAVVSLLQNLLSCSLNRVTLQDDMDWDP